MVHRSYIADGIGAYIQRIIKGGNTEIDRIDILMYNCEKNIYRVALYVYYYDCKELRCGYCYCNVQKYCDTFKVSMSGREKILVTDEIIRDALLENINDILECLKISEDKENWSIINRLIRYLISMNVVDRKVKSIGREEILNGANWNSIYSFNSYIDNILIEIVESGEADKVKKLNNYWIVKLIKNLRKCI